MATGPFDSAHLYMQVSGSLPGPEQWSWGLRFRKKSGGAANDADAAGMLVNVAAAVSAFHTRAGTKIHPAAKLASVKLNAIGTNGRYVTDGTNEAHFADLAGTGAGTQHPNQVALAVSLTTGFSRGPAHRGRFFLPLPGLDLVAGGVCDSGDIGQVKTSATTLLTALNGVNADYEVAVFSRKDGAPGNRKVTGIAVGVALDTQRRRRKSLAEAYV